MSPAHYICRALLALPRSQCSGNCLSPRITGGTDPLGRSVTCSYPLLGASKARAPIWVIGGILYFSTAVGAEFGKTTFIRAGIEEFWLLTVSDKVG